MSRSQNREAVAMKEEEEQYVLPLSGLSTMSPVDVGIHCAICVVAVDWLSKE